MPTTPIKPFVFVSTGLSTFLGGNLTCQVSKGGNHNIIETANVVRGGNLSLKKRINFFVELSLVVQFVAEFFTASNCDFQELKYLADFQKYQ